MTYKTLGFEIRTPSVKAEEIPLVWHFVYQFPLAIALLYTTAGLTISQFVIPAVGLWAIYWANRAN